MPSPFPGMDPYLEGYLYPDVHQRLATKLSQLLTPQLRPRYVARLAVSVIEDETGEAEIGVMYPDVEVIRSIKESAPLYSTAQTPLTVPDVPLTISDAPLLLPNNLKYRQVTVEIRTASQDQLVTSIEILSPVNKRDPGLSQYRAKRRRLHQGRVHLLELDLLRRGQRVLNFKSLNEAPYLVTLTRAAADQIEAWPLHLQDKLPVVPVPLHPPDEPVALDLQSALNAIYAEAAYDLSINYTAGPPPPVLSSADAELVGNLLKSTRESA